MRKRFPVVGIGASAGGLEAFSELLEALPDTTGMAYVYIQHLDPTHKSMLSDIFKKYTRMRIEEAEDGAAIEPDHVYIIPPNRDMVVFHGELLLVPREGASSPHKPIDYFFNSLAEDLREGAIGVVLSGTASDGSQGIKALKAQGGIVIAQEPSTAKYDGMPVSAISTGSVDLVLPPREIAGELVAISAHPYLARHRFEEGEALAKGDETTVGRIFSLLRNSTGVDFTYYKKATIMRRTARRMLLHRLDNLEDYYRYLQSDPEEVRRLFKDLLINVTSFFRNPEQFDALKLSVFADIIQGKTINNPVRVWVPGCSTGEEAYSMAIALLESLNDGGLTARDVPVRIFASDVDEESIIRARSGIYPESIATEVAAERLRAHFTRVEGGYQVKKHVRDLCIFARHDVTRDPPFSRMDLISCRNLLIYVSQVLQNKIVPFFHYALNPQGFLMLGVSESIGRHADLFGLVDKKNKIYVKKSSASIPLLDLEGEKYQPQDATALVKEHERRVPEADPVKAADDLLLSRFAPAGVVINEDLTIIHTRGETDPYFSLTPGAPSLNVIKMARRDLKPVLRTLIQGAKKGEFPLKRRGVAIKFQGLELGIDVEIFPIEGSYPEERYFLLVFKESSAAGGPGRGQAQPGFEPGEETDDSRETRVEALETELTSFRELLESVSEDHEAAIEMLRASEEEIISANEELQSTNEELETAKEELQSSNEELTTLNEELGSRNLELSQANNDLVNVLSSIDIPIIILGNDLGMRRYTPAAQSIFHLQPLDIGRSIDEIKSKLDATDLTETILQVMQELVPRTIETRDNEGRWYDLTIRPYRTTDNVIDGAVISCVDTTLAKAEIELSREFYKPIVNTVRVPLLVLDSSFKLIFANRSFFETFMVTEEESLDRQLFDLGNHQWDIPPLRKLLEQVLPRDEVVEGYAVEHDFESIGHCVMLLNARRIERGEGREPFILLAIEDVTGKQ